ncbi:hypothetical protein B1A99_34920 [Cohnella sp. CIP 111063]|uniref:Hachiman antiphage defense system protein HamA n=1 Tax=unclassified Cohnella TaxID=2636738 RepID=UPI000B8BC1A6|nr:MULTISPECIES: Hachiman antiphage defense system protein HamA [unclassified Cohnella]OXS52152.1 hypothetical protein B1A99_34920 [Cohnella sp. CIP 111063]PRX53397.1 uncharacterized protein DUF1837 [Cohnella sp. SGD-V74]
MEISNQYRELYDSFIGERARTLIVSYDPRKHKYEYKPYSHSNQPKAIDELSNLIIENMIFYAFSEEEVIEQHKQFGLLADLKVAAQYAYEQRLPKRKNPDTDGTTGEVLLDILIQVFEPVSQKMIARAKYKQQGDNSEIKGYDALYFTKNDNEISLWMGQVKTGTYSYCKNSIFVDLNEKYILDYFCKSVFYIADKVESSSLLPLLKEINKICFDSIKNKWSNNEKKRALIDLLEQNQIKIKIPCLLAYTSDIYKENGNLKESIEQIVNKAIKDMDTTDFLIAPDLDHEIIFIIFPFQDIAKLRSKIIEFKNSGE